MKSLQLRVARQEDKDAIVAFCQSTFEWGDYIADVWDDWLADRTGGMFVAVVEERPVGLLHITLLEERVAWMEGMRVHPDYRRLGVATALDHAGREFARRHGYLVARLATSINNRSAQGVLEHEGYRRVAQFNFWTGDAAEEDDVRWHVANGQELAILLDHWSRSTQRSAGHALLPTLRWTFTELTETRLQEQIRAGQVRVSTGGFALVTEDDGDESSALNLHALVGNHDALVALAKDARAEARYRGYPRVEAMAADDVELSGALETAQYTRQGAMLIYEHGL